MIQDTDTNRCLSDLQSVVDRNRGIHPGLDKILDGIVLLSVLDMDAETTKVVIASLAGDFDRDVVRALALVIGHLTTKAGASVTANDLNTWDLYLSATEACAAIDAV